LIPRSWLVIALITLWGARLAAHIFHRHRGKGEDSRYQAMRASHGSSFWWRSLFTVFWLPSDRVLIVGNILLGRLTDPSVANRSSASRRVMAGRA